MLTVKIEGATCQGCVNSIEKAINQLQGVEKVSFDLGSKLATIEGTETAESISAAVENAGFDVVNVNND
jgi:copper chaperone CopZ